MKSKFLVLALLCIIGVAGVAFGQQYLDFDYTSDYTDDNYEADSPYTREDVREGIIWYDVTDEELTYCQFYGGQQAQESYYDQADTISDPVSKLTLAVQGQYTTLGNERMYEFAWYVHPLTEDITYKILLVTQEGQIEELISGYAQTITGDASYEARQTNIIYEKVRLQPEGSEEYLEVDIMEK